MWGIIKKEVFLQEKAEEMAQERDRTAAYSNVHRADPILHCKFQLLQTAPDTQEAFAPTSFSGESEATAGPSVRWRTPLLSPHSFM